MFGSEMIVKLAVGLLAKLVTETFLAKVVIYTLAHWAKTSDNELDNKVVQAMADALGVPVEGLIAPGEPK
jgi:uncharacterized lipoprotein YmbA